MSSKADGASYPSMRSVMAWSLGSLGCGVVLLSFVVVLAVVLTSALLTRSVSEESLSAQADRHVVNASVQLGLAVDGLVESVRSTSVGVPCGFLAQALSGQTASVAPFQPNADPFHTQVPSPTTLPRIPSQTGDPDGSVWYTAGSTSAPALSGVLAQLRENSSALDLIGADVYAEAPAVIAFYAGFEESGFFRLFPGMDSSFTSDYDPRERGWYAAATSLEAGETAAVVGPYLDAFGNGFLLSLAQPMVLPEWAENSGLGDPGAVIGACSCDISVDYLANSVLNVTFFGKAAAQMATVAGATVASPFWEDSDGGDLDPEDDPPAPDIWDLQGAGISRSMWEDSLSANTDAGAQVFLLDGDDGVSRVYARSFVPTHPCDRPDATSSCSSEAYTPSFVIVVAAKAEDVRKPLAAMQAKIDGSTTLVSLVATFACLLTVVVVALIMQRLVHQITAPLEHVAAIAEHITKESGEDVAVAEDQVQLPSDLPNDEVGTFVRNFAVMTKGLAKRTASAVVTPTTLIPNAFQTKPPWEDALRRVGALPPEGGGAAGAGGGEGEAGGAGKVLKM